MPHHDRDRRIWHTIGDRDQDKCMVRDLALCHGGKGRRASRNDGGVSDGAGRDGAALFDIRGRVRR